MRHDSPSSRPLRLWHATTHALQPVQASRSTSKAYCWPGAGAARGHEVAVVARLDGADAARRGAARSARRRSGQPARRATGRSASPRRHRRRTAASSGSRPPRARRRTRTGNVASATVGSSRHWPAAQVEGLLEDRRGHLERSPLEPTMPRDSTSASLNGSKFDIARQRRRRPARNSATCSPPTSAATPRLGVSSSRRTRRSRW